MNKKIVCLKGDGIGPEVVNQALKVMQAVNNRFEHRFELVFGSIGAESIDKFDTPLTDEVIEECRNADAILLGAIGDPKYDNDPSAEIRPEQGLLKLRKELELFANIRPVKAFKGLDDLSPLKKRIMSKTDIVIYRELCGGLYFGDKYTSEDGDFATESCSYSKKEIKRITYAAYDTAMMRRKKLTMVDKANVLETSRLWRKTVKEIAEEYPEVETQFMFVDNAAMQLMLNPSDFDVILTENLFGDILSDLSSVISGSLGLLPSASLGEHGALFEPVHGSYPQATGKDIANPMATILSLAMMYDHLGLEEEAECIRLSVDWAIGNSFVTADLDSNAAEGCSKVGDLIAIYIEHGPDVSFKKENISISPAFF